MSRTMKCTQAVTLAAALLTAALMPAVAIAAPLAQTPAQQSAVGAIEKASGCHRTCRWSPSGWHRHVGPGCARAACSPARRWLWRW